MNQEEFYKWKRRVCVFLQPESKTHRHTHFDLEVRCRSYRKGHIERGLRFETFECRSTHQWCFEITWSISGLLLLLKQQKASFFTNHVFYQKKITHCGARTHDRKVAYSLKASRSTDWAKRVYFAYFEYERPVVSSFIESNFKLELDQPSQRNGFFHLRKIITSGHFDVSHVQYFELFEKRSCTKA